MNTSETFDDDSLFSSVEQQRLNTLFLDDVDNGVVTSAPATTITTHNAPTQILLSSPYQIVGGSTTMYHQHRSPNNIHVNSLLLPTPITQKVTKKYQKKKRPSLTNSSSSIIPSSAAGDCQVTTKKKVAIQQRKQAHELLSDDQKKANHIASEQKRRANIRIGFEKLIEIVPSLSTGHKSEALILQKSVEHLRQLVESKTKLKEKARGLQLMLGEIPDDDSSEGEMDYKF